jgi:hypothetical protein
MDNLFCLQTSLDFFAAFSCIFVNFRGCAVYLGASYSAEITVYRLFCHSLYHINSLKVQSDGALPRNIEQHCMSLRRGFAYTQ